MQGVSQKVQDQEANVHYDVDTVTEFSYLGDRINSGGGCCRKKFSLKIKGSIQKYSK